MLVESALLFIIITTINAATTTQNLLTSDEDPTKGSSLLKGISASAGNVNIYSPPSTVSMNQGIPQAPLQGPSGSGVVGNTFNPNSIFSQIRPLDQPNQFQGVNTQPYQPGQPIPTNLNPNLYSGGFPGRDAGYTTEKMYPRMDATAEASPRNPVGVQGLFNKPGGTLNYANPTIGGVIDKNTIQQGFGQHSNPSSLVGASINPNGLFNMLSPQPSYVTGGAPQRTYQQNQPNSLVGALTGSNDLFSMFGATPSRPQNYQQGFAAPQQQQPSFGTSSYNQPNSMYGVGVNSNQAGTNPSEFASMFDGYGVDSPNSPNTQNSPNSSPASSQNINPANQATQPPHSSSVNAGPASGLSFNR